MFRSQEYLHICVPHLPPVHSAHFTTPKYDVRGEPSGVQGGPRGIRFLRGSHTETTVSSRVPKIFVACTGTHYMEHRCMGVFMHSQHAARMGIDFSPGRERRFSKTKEYVVSSYNQSPGLGFVQCAISYAEVSFTTAWITDLRLPPVYTNTSRDRNDL